MKIDKVETKSVVLQIITIIVSHMCKMSFKFELPLRPHNTNSAED